MRSYIDRIDSLEIRGGNTFALTNCWVILLLLIYSDPVCRHSNRSIEERLVHYERLIALQTTESLRAAM